MSWAAIEAVATSDTKETSDQLRRHLSVLLIKDRNRRSDGSERVNQLYKVRCNIVHGRDPSASEHNADEAFTLANALVAIAMEWYDQRRRLGVDRKHDDFIHEVDEYYPAGRVMPEVLESLYQLKLLGV